MKVLVIGGGHKGASVIRQLQKNKNIQIIVSDWKTDCIAVQEGLIENIDVHAHITPLNVKEILEHVKPDLIVLARSQKDWRHEDTMHGGQLLAGMERELLVAPVPVLMIDQAMKLF